MKLKLEILKDYKTGKPIEIEVSFWVWLKRKLTPKAFCSAYQSGTRLKKSLERGLEQSARGETRDLGSFERYVD